MPSVPSTCVPVDPLVSVALSNPDLLSPDELIAGPTPDPDTDDVVLVPVEDGNAVSQESPENAPPQSSVKPRIELGSLTLHSPSSIVGTPFDPSPRFEYPFPASIAPQMVSELESAIPSFALLSSPVMTIPAVIPSFSVPASISLPSLATSSLIPGKVRAEVRCFSPTHPKLNPRNPPIPPSLVKKVRMNPNGVGDSAAAAAAPDAQQGRARGGSLDMPRGRFNRVEIDAGRRGSMNVTSIHDSVRADSKWKRNSLALGEQMDGEAGAKLQQLRGQNHSSASLS